MACSDREVSEGIPVMPLTKDEIKTLPEERMGQGECGTLRHQAMGNSESGWQLRQIKLTLPRAREAYGILGNLYPAGRPNVRGGGDSSNHMLTC